MAAIAAPDLDPAPASEQDSSDVDRAAAQREAEIERALEGGGELPPNRPRGILGERGLDARKTDDGGPSLFGGVTQEVDPVVVYLAMLVSYLLFFPLAYVILWRYPRFSRTARIAHTIVFTVGLGVAAIALTTR